MTGGIESVKVQSVATPKRAAQIDEGGQLGKVFFHATKLTGPPFCMPCTNNLFNGTFSSPNQMVKIGGRVGGTKFFKGGPFISAGKRGTKCFNGGLIFSENIGPPGPFFSDIFGPGGTVFRGTNCYVTGLGPLMRVQSQLPDYVRYWLGMGSICWGCRVELKTTDSSAKSGQQAPTG